MLGSFQRIEGYFEAFRTAIVKCRTAGIFVAADWQDAYGRLGRLRECYMKEKPNLHESERQALSKVLEKDTFTEGMMNIRHVGEHVKRRGEFTIQATNNAPITLDAESSAAALFSACTVFMKDSGGNTQRIDHLEMLQEMENRIAAAMRRARL